MMTVEELKAGFDCACEKGIPQILNGVGPFFTGVYTNMFHEYPNTIFIGLDGYYLNEDGKEIIMPEPEEEDEYHEEEDDEPEVYKFQNVDVQQTMINFYNYFHDCAYIIRNDDYPIIIADHLIILWDSYIHEIRVLSNSEYLLPALEELVVDNRSSDDVRWASYVTSSTQGFCETMMKIKKQDIDINMNYNDDLPHDQIVNFIKGNKSGLILIHGVPGSGKTSYIRHLMYELQGRHFIILDPGTFNYITDSAFITLLMKNKNAVIVLEDCESMLADRVSGNTQLSTLLNLSDGILGDSFNFKFICTFNANIAKLDKAILRKGRLNVKYEFKALSPEKTKALCEKVGRTYTDGESLTLSDIYNYDVNTGVKEDKKIGFSK